MIEEILPIDVLIVGAGPAGLATAIRLGQLNQQRSEPLSIMVVEKGANLGAHNISGAVFNPSAIQKLIPNWLGLNPPLEAQVSEEKFLWLTKRGKINLPLIGDLKNHGNHLMKLSQFVPWLGEQAMQLGIDIFTGFAAEEILYDHDAVIGVKIGAKGDDVPPMLIHAKQTLFAEGARGYLSEQVIDHFDLRKHADPQTYALGVKEVWKVQKNYLKPGSTIHTTGFPLDNKTYGGGFIYQLNNNELAIGQVIGLDYANPYLNPQAELQRFKQHPFVAKLIKDGECIGYGARTLNEGGFQSLPQCAFNGGLLVGCSAGLLNVGEMKGIHHAINAGMLAAEVIDEHLKESKQQLAEYDLVLRKTATYKGLKRVRNIRPAFKKFGRIGGFVYAAFDQMLCRGKVPWTLRSKQADYQSLKPAAQCVKTQYPEVDNKKIFSKADLLIHTGVHHQEGAKSHLKAKDHGCHKENNELYATPEIYYCPADVYQLVEKDGKKQLNIQSQNCLHCKACDIKNVHQNIKWTTPQGGDGPNYRDM